jgi:type IV pilus biogenesis protein CpaD/CtpE
VMVMTQLVARCSLLIVFGAAAASLAGCATVQPWQRGASPIAACSSTRTRGV